MTSVIVHYAQCDEICWTYPTEKVSVSLRLSEKGLVFCHGVLVYYLLGVCFVHQLKIRVRHMMWERTVSKCTRSQLFGEDLTSLCSSWLFLACLVERSSATWVNLMLSAFWRYLVCEKKGSRQTACLIQCSFNKLKCVRTNTTSYWHHWEALQLSWPGQCSYTLQSPSRLLSSSSGLNDTGSAEQQKGKIKNQVIFLCRHLSKRLGLIASSRLSPHFAGNKPFWPAGPWCHQAWRCSRAALCDIPGHLPGPEPFWHGSGWSCREEGCTWSGSPWSPSCIQS